MPTDIEIAQEAVWLAFQASRPVGLGHAYVGIAARLTRKEVAELVLRTFGGFPPIVCADYIAGRMVKLVYHFDAAGQVLPKTGQPSIDLQSWCHKYSTYNSLWAAAKASIE